MTERERLPETNANERSAVHIYETDTSSTPPASTTNTTSPVADSGRKIGVYDAPDRPAGPSIGMIIAIVAVLAVLAFLLFQFVF